MVSVVNIILQEMQECPSCDRDLAGRNVAMERIATLVFSSPDQTEDRPEDGSEEGAVGGAVGGAAGGSTGAGDGSGGDGGPSAPPTE